MITLSPIDRFFKHVQKSDDPDACWLWTGSKNQDGYGNFWDSRKVVRAHRFSYGHYIGQIPKGLYVLHRCDTPACVNPKHLFVGTQKDNMQDASRKSRCSYQLHPEFAPRGKQHGTHRHPERVARGERVSSARVTEAQVREIRKRYALGGITQRQLAKDFGVTVMTVCRIVLRKSWQHVE